MSAMGRDSFPYLRLLPALSSLALDTSRDPGAATAALGTLCQLLPTFTGNNSCPISNPSKQQVCILLLCSTSSSKRYFKFSQIMNEHQESRKYSKQQLCVSSSRLFNPGLNTSGINVSIPRAAKQTNRNVPLGKLPGTALGTQSTHRPAGSTNPQFPCVCYPSAHSSF